MCLKPQGPSNVTINVKMGLTPVPETPIQVPGPHPPANMVPGAITFTKKFLKNLVIIIKEP